MPVRKATAQRRQTKARLLAGPRITPIRLAGTATMASSSGIPISTWEFKKLRDPQGATAARSENNITAAGTIAHNDTSTINLAVDARFAIVEVMATCESASPLP